MKKILIAFLVLACVFSITGKASALLVFGCPASYEGSVYDSFPTFDYTPAITAIDTFLANPTLESLKTFCSVTINVPNGTKEVLNATRTGFTTETTTTPFSIPPGNSDYSTSLCAEVANSLYWGITWTTYNPSLYKPLALDPADSDSTRTSKLLYNNQMLADSNSQSSYKLIGSFSSEPSRFILPEEILSNMRTEFEPDCVSPTQQNPVATGNSTPVNNQTLDDLAPTTYLTAGNNAPQDIVPAISTTNDSQPLAPVKALSKKVQNVQVVPSAFVPVITTAIPPKKIGWFRALLNWFK